jgi:hypothetical protein
MICYIAKISRGWFQDALQNSRTYHQFVIKIQQSGGIISSEAMRVEELEEEHLDKLTKISEMIKALKEKKFTGHIKIDFDGGAVIKVQKFEEILKK